MAGASDAILVLPSDAADIEFVQQPSSVNAAGQPLLQQPQLRIRDDQGNLMRGEVIGLVELTLYRDGQAVAFGGASSVPLHSSDGIIRFHDLHVHQAADGYRFTAKVLAASGRLVLPVNSSEFKVLPGPAARAAWASNPPPLMTAGDQFIVTLIVTDVFGNGVSDDQRSEEVV